MLPIDRSLMVDSHDNEPESGSHAQGICSLQIKAELPSKEACSEAAQVHGP